jgi:type II secretory pathway pseudopilin PulG
LSDDKKTTPSLPILSAFTRKRGKGFLSFTTSELIAAIILIGILVASVFILFPQTKKRTKDVTAVDQVIADIQHAQAQAMGSLDSAQQKNIVFTIGSNAYSMSGKLRNLPNGVTVIATNLPGNTLAFNSLGEPTFGQGNRTITLTGDTVVTVHAITGMVERHK